nr:MAG TPA: 8-oxoguanine DNA glycosylase [Caudoviricetes sp.]
MNSLPFKKTITFFIKMFLSGLCPRNFNQLIFF